MTKKTLDKAAAASLKMGNVPHKRPPKASVKEMNRKFKICPPTAREIRSFGKPGNTGSVN